jgi:uncharacterized RDD family membrane protein YckC
MAATPVRLALASRWQRFFGQMIDGSIASAPMMVVPAIGGFNSTIGTAWMGLGVCWALFYLFLGDGLHGGQSLAKQWLGTRVVDAETGAPCTWGRSFVRNIFTILGPIDWIFIFGDAHQRLGDKVARTVVVEAD